MSAVVIQLGRTANCNYTGPSKSLETLTEEGVDAYCYGHPRASCPYPFDSTFGVQWLRGWDEAAFIDDLDKV